MKKLCILFVMALISLNDMAQSCDAAYPVGPWQTYYDYDLMAEIFMERETTPNSEFDNRKGCGVLKIRDNNTDDVLFYGLLSYIGKSIDKNGYPLPIYNFDVVTKQGKTCQIAIQKFKSKEGSYGNGMEIKILGATGELANDTILKKPLYLVGHGYTDDVTINAEGEKDLLGRLKKVLDDKFGWAVGFGDVQHFRQYINAHAKLDPNKLKYAKCKGNSVVNIRESYNAQSKKIGELKPGTTLLVMDEYDGWCLVKMEDGKNGCVSLSVVTLTNTPVSNSPTGGGTGTREIGGGGTSPTTSTTSKQRNHMEFLGLEMGGNPAQFIQALRQKGFKDGSGFSQDKTQVFLSGMVYGMQSEICVYTEGNRVNSVSVINMVNTKTAAVNRCNRFKKEISALYGGKWTTPYDGAAELTLPYGKVKYEYGMFDSGVYELSMFIIDTGTSAPAPQQTNGDDMLTIIDNQISTAKKKVQENPTSDSYYELANILYLKYTKINDDSEKKNILTEIDNIYKIIIDQYPNTSAIAVIGRATIINIFNPDIKQGVAKPLYEKYLQMIEPKIKNKTYNDEEKNGYLAACLYMYRYYSELSNFKQVKYYLKKYDAVDPGNENIRKMLELVKDY